MKKIIKKYKWIIIIVVTLALLLFVGEKILNQDNSSSYGITQTGSETETVKKGNLTKSVSVNGTVETANYLSVTTSVNGIVKQVFVKEGDIVKKNQKIMEITLDSEGEKSLQSAYANYLKSKNSLDSAVNSLKTAENTLISKEQAFDNVKKSTSYSTESERDSFKIAENEYLVAKESYDLKKSEITQLQISLNNSWLDYQTQSPVILSPSDGVISNITAVEGVKIENSVTSDRSVQTVASIKKEGTPIAKVNVSEIDVANIQVGQKVILKLNSIQDSSFEGEVISVDKVGTISSGVANYPVIIKFKKDDERIFPNMNVSAQIIVKEKQNALYIPTSAISTQNNKSYVTLIQNGKQSSVEVKTGFVGDSSTEITQGLSEGDKVGIQALPTSGFTTTSSQNTTRRSPGIFGIFGGR